jgi:mediator of RNA polymerase II transcription subunit 23
MSDNFKCVIYLQVFDLVIHRFIELPPIGKQIEMLLESLGGLYKFHGKLNN